MMPREPKLITHRATGLRLLALALLLLALAIPQAISAWLTVPENFDHTRKTLLTAPREKNFRQAMQILPQPETASALSYAAIKLPVTTTQQRTLVVNTALAAVKLSPGDPANWYYLAAALEPEIFERTRMVLFDQALTMSMMTGPLTRDLILPRGLLVVRQWQNLSQPVRDALQDQIFNLWAMAPWDLRNVYLAMPTEGQMLIFETLEQAPGESIKFNKYIDNPNQMPQ